MPSRHPWLIAKAGKPSRSALQNFPSLSAAPVGRKTIGKALRLPISQSIEFGWNVNHKLATKDKAPATSQPGRTGVPVMGLREHKKLQVRKTVLSTSVKLFESQGFANTSMDQIAAASMISRTTLFNYFPSKDSIVLELAKPFEDVYPGIVREICTEPGTTAQRIERVFAAAADHFIKYRSVNSVIYLELTRIRSVDQQANNAAIKKYRDALITLLQLGVEQGDVRTDISPGLIADIILAPLLMGVYRMFGGTEDFDIKANFNIYARLLTDAVAIRQPSF